MGSMRIFSLGGEGCTGGGLLQTYVLCGQGHCLMYYKNVHGDRCGLGMVKTSSRLSLPIALMWWERDRNGGPGSRLKGWITVRR